MKTIVLLSFVLLTFTSYSQNKNKAKKERNKYKDELYYQEKTSRDGIVKADTLNNFIVNDNGVIWQYVYKDVDSINTVKEYLKESGFLKLDKEENSNSSYIVENHSLNTTKFYSTMETSILLRYPMNAKVIIEFRDNRYRVTLQNIVFIPNMNVGFGFYGGAVSTNSNRRLAIEEYAYNYNSKRIKRSFSMVSRQFNTVLIDMFTVKSIIKQTTEDW